MSSRTPEEMKFCDSMTFVSKYPNVVFEESEQEVVVVNLITGVYYFVTGAGAFTWMAVQSGMSVGEVLAELLLTARESDNVQEDLASFLEELVVLGLLVESESGIAREHGRPVPSEYMVNGYSAPSFESYADLQDILLLDPVHDVDETGWPSAK